MNKSALMRIMNDIVDFNENKPEGIYLYFDKKNIKTQFALIMGPDETPYFGGYFFFEIIYPDEYPKNSPKVRLLTTDKDVRFNPNLYEDGKVCLSILGTWAGPSWTPVMNIRLVLDSIRSLMGHFPVKNEPGLENIKPDDIISMEYNQYLIYNTYRVAIIDVLNNKFASVSDFFKNEIGTEIIKNHKKLLDNLLSYEHIYGNAELEKRIYFMKKTKINFSSIVELFSKINI